MLEGLRIAVVLPAFNEARWIKEAAASIPAYVDHTIVVDDHSSDATREQALAAGDPRVEVVRHQRNLGVGAAIVSGYRAALARGASIVAVMAGDGQMHPDDLAAVVAPIASGEADYVKGDRFAHPDVRRSMPIHRFGAGLALSYLTRRAAGLSALSDSQCGYTAISARALLALDLDALWPRYGYVNDLIGAVSLEGMRVRDVVVRPVYRGEASGLRPWHLVTIGYLIARVATRRLARQASRQPLSRSP